MSEQEGTGARQRVQALVERAEALTLWLAVVAVAIYLAELQGVWVDLGVQDYARGAALVIDLVFVVDLLAKVWSMRGEYLRSPWFVIDVISATPVLASLQVLPVSLQGVRFVRGFRVFRLMATLRVLRSLRILRALQIGKEEAHESRAFERTLSICVITYTVLFLALVGALRAGAPQGQVVTVEGTSLGDQVAIVVVDAEGDRTSSTVPVGDLFTTPEDAEFTLVLGSIFGMLLVLVVVRFQIPDITTQHVRALLNVAMPQQVAQYFIDHPEDAEYSGLHVRMPASILFADIRGFTSTVEKLHGDLVTLKAHLENAMDAIVEVHVGHDLIVDKFIGDAIMSFRGGDLVDGTPQDHARRMVGAGIESVEAIRNLGDPYFYDIKVGGASATDALIGTFGTSARLSYTILGDRVNLAARLEAACGRFGTTTLFCDRTHELCADKPGVVWRRVGKLRVAGKHEVIDVYEAFGESWGDFGWLSTFDAGVESFEARDLEGALALFLRADQERDGGDPPSRWYVQTCRSLIATGLPSDWEPVIETRK